MKLHITEELTEKDVVSRIMRKENYLIGMLNKVGASLSASVSHSDGDERLSWTHSVLHDPMLFLLLMVLLAVLLRHLA